MPRRTADQAEFKPDMTPMMDVCFQLIIFFVLIMTIAKDEDAQKVKLPLALEPPIVEDEQLPRSININIISPAELLGWGQTLDLRSPEGMRKLRDLMRLEAKILEEEQARHAAPPVGGSKLDATVVVRVSEDVEYEVFQNVIALCQEVGFQRFQLKARPKEDADGSP
jgi:biopolymer transport protein ExbD